MIKLFRLSVLVSVSSLVSAQHTFTLVNHCSTNITPVIANTACGYSPRCTGAAYYTAAQPGVLVPGGSEVVTLPVDWVGRIFAQNGACGASGEDCTITEFNLDSGSIYTPQSYDISNIQGFTQSIEIEAAGCDTVTCTSVDCSCDDAYPPGSVDITTCGDDAAVRACGAGNIAFTIVFCP